MNTTSTLELDPPHPKYGSRPVFSLTHTADRSDKANQLGFDTITYRDKSDEHLHSEMLVVAAILRGDVDIKTIKSWGVSRKLCKNCGIVLEHVLNHLGVDVPYDENYNTTNWTNPWKIVGLAQHLSPPGVPWQ